MNDYIITVNSTVDLPKEWLNERKVPVVPLSYTIDGETYKDMAGLSVKEFFGKLRAGKMAVTSQVNPGEAKEALKPFLEDGKDILHLAFSSALSGTCNSMRIAAEELTEEYPDRKIIVVDTLCACLGEGLLLHVDNQGALQVIGKERGRKKALNKIVDTALEQSEGWKNDIIMITHGDCEEDARYVEKLVREKMGIDNIIVNNIGTVIGSHTGPGVAAVFCMGKAR